MSTKFFVPRADRRLGDRYELVECLGDGSYGWVWRAQRLDDGAIESDQGYWIRKVLLAHARRG